MGIGRGDEVVTTPVSFVATVGSIVHVGATPVFADVREDQNIDPAEIEKKITPRTKAIMPVHWSGRMCDMDALHAVAERHGIPIIEDSAQCMGSYWKGRHGGTFGTVGAISAHPLKNLNAVGDGGFLLGCGSSSWYWPSRYRLWLHRRRALAHRHHAGGQCGAALEHGDGCDLAIKLSIIDGDLHRTIGQHRRTEQGPLVVQRRQHLLILGQRR